MVCMLYLYLDSYTVCKCVNVGHEKKEEIMYRVQTDLLLVSVLWDILD